MFLNFEKETPDKYLVAVIFLIVLTVYTATGIVFLERIQDTLLGAFITLVVGRLTMKQQTVQANTIEKAEINTEGERPKSESQN